MGEFEGPSTSLFVYKPVLSVTLNAPNRFWFEILPLLGYGIFDLLVG